MASVENYRECVKKLLSKYASYKYSYGEVETQTVFDTERDHYQIVNVGWEQKHRVYGCSIHIDIKDGKVWIQWNGTDIDIGEELAELGVPKHHIVIGFHPPYMRQLTEYAVG
jgi:XisI protein